MRLTSLRVKNIRTHKEYVLPIDPVVTLITGSNGSGKTSLLESLYIALQGSSFKGSDGDILKRGASWYRIDVQFDDNQLRTVKFDPARSSGKKQFEIDSKVNYRLPFTGKYPVVLFEPDELRLLHGSPERRRRFIDRFIGQFDQEYAQALRRYERALKQRNILLKNLQGNTDDLFVWDVLLSKHGSYIVKRRIEIIAQLQPQLQAIYAVIAHSKDEAGIQYSMEYHGSIEQRLLSELHQSATRDRILGYTSVGPHRHDIYFTLNNDPAANIASRGEVRTIVLALKFLEVDILKNATEKDPVILLDDVFSELDESRQKALIERFSEYQTIISSVDTAETNFPVHRLSH